jgi:hypothetical protein
MGWRIGLEILTGRAGMEEIASRGKRTCGWGCKQIIMAVTPNLNHEGA